MTKTRKTEYRAFTSAELKSLVQRAQARDQQAIDRLCAAFTPLIYKEARRSYIAAALGDDAVNIAWEIFLEFIYAYNGNKYRLLPGLIQKHLYYELMHKVYRNKPEQAIISLDAAADDEQQLQIADEKQLLAKLEDKLLLEKLLAALTDKQRLLIEAIFMHGLSLREYAQSQGISFTAAYKMQLKALSRLREKLK